MLRSVPGTNVVTTGLDHASVRSARLAVRCDIRRGRRIAEPNRETASVPVDRIYDLIDKDTCLLAVIHTSNVTGEVFDVATIVREARIKPDLFVMVDGVRSLPAGSWTSRTSAPTRTSSPLQELRREGMRVHTRVGPARAAAALEIHLQASTPPGTSAASSTGRSAAWSAVVDYLFGSVADSRAQPTGGRGGGGDTPIRAHQTGPSGARQTGRRVRPACAT